MGSPILVLERLDIEASQLPPCPPDAHPAGVFVAALYVDEGGPYASLPDVEVWGVTRDARTYAGPHPVVAHPPCARWGRYWFGGPSVRPENKRKLGDDDGCFAAALASVERWGGVLEHPASSKAWAWHGIGSALRGAWILTTRGGWTCELEQGRYGHRARKATWLYYVGSKPPAPLDWGVSVATAAKDAGYCSAEERARGKRTPNDMLERMGHVERRRTPVPFAELLIAMARSSR